MEVRPPRDLAGHPARCPVEPGREVLDAPGATHDTDPDIPRRRTVRHVEGSVLGDPETHVDVRTRAELKQRLLDVTDPHGPPLSGEPCEQVVGILGLRGLRFPIVRPLVAPAVVVDADGQIDGHQSTEAQSGIAEQVRRFVTQIVRPQRKSRQHRPVLLDLLDPAQPLLVKTVETATVPGEHVRRRDLQVPAPVESLETRPERQVAQPDEPLLVLVRVRVFVVLHHRLGRLPLDRLVLDPQTARRGRP